ISEILPAEWDLMMAVNLRAPLFLAQAALPHMRERGGGSVINIGSIEGLGANPDHAAYCASKAGIHGVGRPTDVGALAVYLAGDSSSFLTGEIVVLDGGRTAKLPLPS